MVTRGPSGLKILRERQTLSWAITIILTIVFEVFLILIFKFLSIAIDSLVDYKGGGVINSDFIKIMITYTPLFLAIFISHSFSVPLSYKVKRFARVNLQGYLLRQLNMLSLNQFMKSDLSKQQLFYSRLKSDTNQYVLGRIENILSIVGAVAGLATTLVVLSFSHWLILVILILSSSIMQTTTLLFKRVFTKAQVKISEGNTDFNSVTQDYLNNWELLYFNNKQHLIKSVSRRASVFKTEQTNKLAKLQDLNSFSNSSLSNLIFEVTRFILLYLILTRVTTLTVGQVALFTSLFYNILPKINSIVRIIILDRSLRPIFDKFKVKLEVEERGYQLKSLKEISVSNLSLSYPAGDKGGKKKPIFKGLNLKFKVGKRYAIVGPSGSGKSSFVKLLLGANFEYGGKVLFDGIELRQIEEESLRELFGFVGPDNFVFDDSLINNVTLWDKQRDPTLALERANLLSEFPDWNETETSALSLSEGQKQRICLARVFYQDKPVIIFDEALANLDKENVRVIKENILREGRKDRIYIFISHHIDGDDNFFDEIISFDKD